MHRLYDLLYLLGLAILWPVLVYRRICRGPGSLALGERLGRVPSRRVSGSAVWIHGVSLGEINASRTIVAELRRRSPDTAVAISSTTATGLARARAIYPDLTVFRFPIDFSFALNRVLTAIRPSAIVLMELEVWPNLIEVARRHDIPVMIANGRITAEKTMRQFRKPLLRPVARRMFRQLDWIGAQDSDYADRFIELGAAADRVHVVGSVKYDAADVADWIAGQTELANEMAINRRQPLWVCGSTGPGEEEVLLDAWSSLREHYPDVQLALIPRKPERFDEVASLINQRGYVCFRRSTGAPQLPDAGTDEDIPHVLLGDTMGELRKFYALATVVFVGRTLVAMGGSDVMEAAGLAKPILMGPHTQNFREAVELLRGAGGCRIVRESRELAEAVTELLRNPSRREQMGQVARETILARRGATEATVDAILRRFRE